MALGRERKLIESNWLKRLIVGMIGDTHFGRVLRFLYFKQKLETLQSVPKTILDAGCGKGYMAMYLAKRYPHSCIVGVDINLNNLMEAEQIRNLAGLDNLIFICGDVQDVMAANAFDLIISSEVLEYIADEHAVLQQFYCSLRLGGELLLHLIDVDGGYEQLGARKLFGLQTQTWRDTGMIHTGYTKYILQDQLQSVGFSHIEIESTFGYLGMFAHSWFEVGRNWPSPLYLALFPLLLILGYLDTRVLKTRGGALLALARKF